MSNLALYSALAVFAAIVYSAAIGTSQATWSGNYSSPLINQGFLYGWICALISTPLIKAGAKCILSYYFTGIGQDKLYGLDHVLLDVKIPPPSMWINMGYWKVRQSSRIFLSNLNNVTYHVYRIHNPSLKRAPLFWKKCSKQQVC